MDHIRPLHADFDTDVVHQFFRLAHQRGLLHHGPSKRRFCMASGVSGDHIAGLLRRTLDWRSNLLACRTEYFRRSDVSRLFRCDKTTRQRKHQLKTQKPAVPFGARAAFFPASEANGSMSPREAFLSGRTQPFEQTQTDSERQPCGWFCAVPMQLIIRKDARSP